MRILVVSAHFPPNFVSGGTLAPWRLARGLAEAGHEVSVYAGWLDHQRRPLETWTAAETAPTVRWIVTTPWIDWADRRNYDNPSVTADFAAHLAVVRPDVVHFHSIQSLGAGLLPVARASGASVVVTMHDFWWICGRQFLATPALEPCCPVVSCGNCRCEVDRPWLEERDAVLRGYLECADVVLAVSRSLGEVIEANGLCAGRVRLDENGLEQGGAPAAPPSGPERPAPHHAGGLLRLTYAGGHHPLKGVHVMLDAVSRLAGEPGWRCTLYGAEDYLRSAGVVVHHLPVEVREPFEPAETGAVLAETDVLVVPSVAQESYSLITREALAAGVPVICSDTFGPEEVVVHGRNGLVVPAGDASALAAAVARLLHDPALLSDLRAGCAVVPVRSVVDQVAGLERLYSELVDGRQPRHRAGARRQAVRRVLFIVGIEGAPLRYRARLPAEALQLAGVEAEVRHYRDADVPALVDAADRVVVYRVPATIQVLELMDRARRRGATVLFDVDDLIFDPAAVEGLPAVRALPDDERDLYLEGIRRYRTTLEACDGFIGSTAELCRQVERVAGLATARFDNGVGMLLAKLSDVALASDRAPGPLRIGYLSGTATHDHDWLHVEPVVADLLREREDVELWLGGLLRPSPALDRFGGRVHRLPLLAWHALPTVLRDLDVNLAPLQPGTRFNEAKSAIKWLEAALTATPTVASPTEPFREAIRSGENGILAATSAEWADAVRLLLDDELLRGRMGRRARRDALLRWSPHRQGARYLEILEEAPTWPRKGASAWVPVVHDEPFVRAPLEPYELPAPVAAHQPGGADGAPASVLRRAWRSLREEGAVVTARRAAAFSGRRLGAVRSEVATRIDSRRR